MFEEDSTEETEFHVIIAGVAVIKSLLYKLLYFSILLFWHFMKCCILAEPLC